MKGVRVFFLCDSRLLILLQLVYLRWLELIGMSLVGSSVVILVAVFLETSTIVAAVLSVVAVTLICVFFWFVNREYIYHAKSLSYDHWQRHNEHWKGLLKELYKENKKYVEAGTVKESNYGDKCIEVQWDCGFREHYSQSGEGRWESIRVYDLGPAGS